MLRLLHTAVASIRAAIESLGFQSRIPRLEKVEDMLRALPRSLPASKVAKKEMVHPAPKDELKMEVPKDARGKDEVGKESESKVARREAREVKVATRVKTVAGWGEGYSAHQRLNAFS